MLVNAEIFQKNVKRWADFCPENAQELSQLQCQRVFFAPSRNEKSNIYQDVNGEREYFHSVDDPVAEAKRWFDSQNLKDINFLYVYGVGLGYVFEAAKNWLRDQNHYLIFLEDDLEVLHRLFETVIGSEILNHAHVHLEYFDKNDLTFTRKLTEIYWRGFIKFTALGLYQRKYPDFSHLVNMSLSFWHQYFIGTFSECLDYGEHFYRNFFPNLFNLPNAYQGKALFHKFEKVPAIICGAGPSLDKNFDVLETLSDRALIFAGGTALNAVNSSGFIPHFGLGLDPHQEHLSRLLMNMAFEIPFFYRNRIDRDSLKAVHGPNLYITGAGGFNTPDWFESQLGIKGFHVEEGFNVVNFSLAIATAMGCNPIIFVGVDLAYSEKKSYKTGVIPHPVEGRHKAFRTKRENEELLTRNDIYGNPVNTLWKWVNESLWLSEYVKNHPSNLFINATEGGIGIPGVPNVPLSQVAKSLLVNRSDLRTRVHGEIQSGIMPTEVTIDKIKELQTQFLRSLEKCKKYLEAISEGHVPLIKLLFEESGSEEISDECKMNIELLKQEIGYKYLLEHFQQSHIDSNKLSSYRIEFDPTLSLRQKKSLKAQLAISGFSFLHKATKLNIELIESTLKSKESSSSLMLEKQIEISLFAKEDNYTFDLFQYLLIDHELAISYSEDFTTSQPVALRENYPNGLCKFEQYYMHGLPHGPATFFALDGKILGKSWFVKGVQQGKTILYYSNGAVYTVQLFKDGLLQGPQKYYYQNGQIKSLITYALGRLHGEVILYYPTGSKKRQLHFENGLRHGVEQMWLPDGKLIVEAHYRQNNPIGTARTWHSNGRLAHEVVYDDNSQVISMQRWDSEGILLREQEDFFDALIRNSFLLTDSLDNVCEKLEAMAPLVVKDPEALQKDFIDLKEKMAQLHQLSDKIVAESGMKKEPIWKTPMSQREMEEKMDEITKKLAQEMSNIQELMKNLPKKPPTET